MKRGSWMGKKWKVAAVVAAVVVIAAAVAGYESSDSSNTNASESASEPSAVVAEDPGEWATVFEYTVRQDDEQGVESERFTLDGPARLRYTVTATPLRPSARGRVADIYFQDERLNVESSRTDTIIDIDDPGTGTEDLGERSGEFFVSIRASGGTAAPLEPGGIVTSGWADTVVTVTIEQRK